MQLPFQADGNSLATNDESRVNEIIRTPIYSVRPESDPYHADDKYKCNFQINILFRFIFFDFMKRN